MAIARKIRAKSLKREFGKRKFDTNEMLAVKVR